ncbi:tol-pal system-associated acyl-CoA thioesterase [Undibacterium sp.]|uniref:tol-pal system-associated acyl-CoA thioesterase n=1 Tax=Undibacterium sp. TaxID=1914977 RepID=UPI0025DC96B1|nr:tol-pal system-associated acyl-CoA thioesterase [Undibacterium sp.]
MPEEFNWMLRVYYEDTDAGGIVFYANYLKFFERARTEWLRAAGVNQQQMLAQYQAMFVVKSTAVEYHAPARLDDEIRIAVIVERLGRASVQFIQQAWCGDRLLCSGKIKVGCVDALSLRPSAIPEPVLAMISL